MLKFQFVLLDYATGFGGKYGVQKDRVDQSAEGYEYHADLSKHESQKGMIRFASCNLLC